MGTIAEITYQKIVKKPIVKNKKIVLLCFEAWN